MLDYIEQHKVGILTTIIIHLLIVTLFMGLQFSNSIPKREKQVIIDFVDEDQLKKEIEEKKAEVKKVAQQELVKELSHQAKNIAVNEVERDAEKNIDKMVNEIKGELNIKERSVAADPNQIANQKKEVEKKGPLPTPQKQNFTLNEKGEPQLRKGNTTISYKLDGRAHVYLPIPVYKCQGSGKVIVDIIVDQGGFVTSTTIRKKESIITDNCLEEAAIRAALTSRFEVKSTANLKQSGSISYTFIAQ